MRQPARKPHKPRLRLSTRICLAAAIVSLAGLAVLTARLPWSILAAYALVGAVSYGLYAIDKARARRGEWRISEGQLHSVDLAFGIVGGLMAQELIRHKSSKAEFFGGTFAIAALHLLGLVAAIIAGPQLQSMIAEHLPPLSQLISPPGAR